MRQLFTFIFALMAQLAVGQDSMFSKAMRTTVVTRVNTLLTENYVYPEKVKPITDKLRFNLSNGKYDSIEDPEEFANQLTTDLRELTQDKHLRIQFDKKLEADLIEFLSSSKKANPISEADLDKDRTRNYHLRRVEILPLNIGYVELTGFALPSKSTSETIFSAMRFVANSNAVILDLRNNFGGNAQVANEILSYFFSEKKFIGRSYSRIENVWTDQYTDQKKKALKKLVLNMPVYVLVSDRTFSAAEGLAYNLQQLRNGTVIGEKTHGGAHLTRSFSAENGFVAFIPFSRGENSRTKTDWEGTGVQPQLIINEDRALSEAQVHALNSLLAKQTDEAEKRKITYAINYLNSRTNGFIPKKSLEEAYLGSYEYFEVSYAQNQLLFQDTKNHKKPILMTPISANFYQVGDEYQIAFQVNEEGKCTAFQMYGEDGWQELILRTNSK